MQLYNTLNSPSPSPSFYPSFPLSLPLSPSLFYPSPTTQRLALDRNDPNRFLTATKDANKSKNRYVNVLPCKPMNTMIHY